MQLAIEAEQERLRQADEIETAQKKRETDRLRDPISSSSAPGIDDNPVKPEPSDMIDEKDVKPVLPSFSRSVKVENVLDEEDIKPFQRGVKRSASEDTAQLHSTHPFSSSSRYGYNHDDNNDSDSDNEDEGTADGNFHDAQQDLFVDEEVKPDFDEALEPDIIDLTGLDDDMTADIKPITPEPTIPFVPVLKTENEAETHAQWSSSNQLTRFRLDAKHIADQYLASKHADLRFKKRAKSTFRKDAAAFEQGQQDAEKIDLKRKRIQN
jgi:hypothetical protein